MVFVDDVVLGAGRHGAFSVENGGTIYLERGLLADPAALESVFLEEAGHRIDAAVGGPDARGDEGALFALAATDGVLDARSLEALLSENDGGAIVVDGRTVTVEFNEDGGDDSGEALVSRLTYVDDGVPVDSRTAASISRTLDALKHMDDSVSTLLPDLPRN